jgi:hypothetical protein
MSSDKCPYAFTQPKMKSSDSASNLSELPFFSEEEGRKSSLAAARKLNLFMFGSLYFAQGAIPKVRGEHEAD